MGTATRKYAHALEHDLGRHAHGRNLEHVLLQHEVTTPRREEVLFQRAADGAVIKETADAWG